MIKLTEKTTCNFLHALDSPYVRPKSKYSLWGWIVILFGISVRPKQVVYSCERCGKVIKVDNSPSKHVF